MKNKFCFLFVTIIAFVALLGVSCSVSLLTTEISITPSVTPSPIPSPTFTPVTYPTMTPYPTDISYPTASIVNAKAVAFISEEGNGNSLWIANVDGSGERKLTDIEHNTQWGSEYLLKWSPDGKWIGYISGDDLWIISPDGSVKRKLLSFPDRTTGTLYTYVWSPDSSKIAYIQKATDGPVAQITVTMFDLVTGKTLEISSNQAPDPMPISWSPDGKYILFAKDFSYSLYEVATGKITKEIKPNGMGCWVGWSIW